MKGIEISHGKIKKKIAFPKWEFQVRLGPILSLKARLFLYQQLGSMLNSQLSLSEGLEVLQNQTGAKGLETVLTQLQADLERGLTFSEACKRQKGVFSSFEIHSLQMGEQSGQLFSVLPKIATFFERRQMLRRKLKQALTYPMVVILIAVLVVAFMLGFVVPMFADIFQRFDAELPPLTQFILSLADTLQNYIGLIIPILLALMILVYWMSQQKVYQDLFGRLSLQLPLLGKLIHKLHLARMSYALAMLLKAKIHLDEALKLGAEITSLSPMKLGLQQIRLDIIKGEGVYHAFRKHRIFPTDFLQMIKVAEKTTRLPLMLEKLAQKLEEESKNELHQLTQLIEPLLIILIGGLVAIILVSMYLPMFELSRAMAG